MECQECFERPATTECDRCHKPICDGPICCGETDDAYGVGYYEFCHSCVHPPDPGLEEDERDMQRIAMEWQAYRDADQ